MRILFPWARVRRAPPEEMHGEHAVATRNSVVARFQHLCETNVLLAQVVLLLKFETVHLLADPFEQL